MFFPGQHGLHEASLQTENIGKIYIFFLKPVFKNLKYLKKLYHICKHLFIFDTFLCSLPVSIHPTVKINHTEVEKEVK